MWTSLSNFQNYPYHQPRNIEYPYKGPKNYCRSFQFLWFESHENWLNYILVYLYYNPPPQVIILDYVPITVHRIFYPSILYIKIIYRNIKITLKKKKKPATATPTQLTATPTTAPPPPTITNHCYKPTTTSHYCNKPSPSTKINQPTTTKINQPLLQRLPQAPREREIGEVERWEVSDFRQGNSRWDRWSRRDWQLQARSTTLGEISGFRQDRRHSNSSRSAE